MTDSRVSGIGTEVAPRILPISNLPHELLADPRVPPLYRKLRALHRFAAFLDSGCAIYERLGVDMLVQELETTLDPSRAAVLEELMRETDAHGKRARRKSGRAACGFCGHDVSAKLDGLLRSHGAPLCPGSGTDPGAVIVRDLGSETAARSFWVDDPATIEEEAPDTVRDLWPAHPECEVAERAVRRKLRLAREVVRREARAARKARARSLEVLRR